MGESNLVIEQDWEIWPGFCYAFQPTPKSLIKLEPIETQLARLYNTIQGPLPEATPTESDRRIVPDLVGFDRLWSDLVGFGRIWSYLVGFGRIWLDFDFWSDSDSVGFCRIGSDLVGFGQIWSDLVEFGRIWTDLVGFGQIWSDLDGFGRIWSDLVILVGFFRIRSDLVGFGRSSFWGRGPNTDR